MKDRYLLRFDEINRLLEKNKNASYEELCDLLYMEMYEAYKGAYGKEPKEDLIELLIFLPYDGRDAFDLLEEAYSDEDWVRINTIFTNEYHRMYNAGAHDGAKGKYKTKEWITAGDNKVRDTHFYLEGVTIPIDADFITYDGDKAQYPGGFSNASNNVNCRCILKYK